MKRRMVNLFFFGTIHGASSTRPVANPSIGQKHGLVFPKVLL